MILAGLGMLASTALMSNMLLDETGMNFPIWIFALIYPAFSLIYIIPSLFLYRFAINGQEAARLGSSHPLEKGADNLRRFFKFYGIVAIIFLVLYPLTLILIFVGGGLGLMSAY